MFCTLFGYSKQAYYKHLHFQQSSRAECDHNKSLVLGVRALMPRLGTRKLHYILKSELSIGRDRLFTLLREEGLLIGRTKKYTVTTNSKHWMRKYPNLIQDIVLVRPEQVWVADITYIDTMENGFAYLHLITDAYSKQIMGYELCDNMEASSTLKALKMAVSKRKYATPIIHHSDRGLQYCSKIYTDYLISKTFIISMTQSSDPYENAIAERVNGILKHEFGLADKLTNIKDALKQTSQSIDIYNTLRPHCSCNMLTPIQMHQQNKIIVKTYKKKAPISTVDIGAFNDI